MSKSEYIKEKELSSGWQRKVQCLNIDHSPDITNNAIHPPYKHISKIASPEEKIALLRSLFQGRVDVYPRLWINKKTGKKGFSTVCNNEWVEGYAKDQR